MTFQINNPQNFEAVERMSDGMRSYFGRIYNYMACGLILSGLMAYLTVHTPLINLFYTQTAEGIQNSILGIIAMIAPLVLVFMISSSINRLNTARAQGLFWLFSALMGISFSNIFLMFSGTSIFQAFLITAGMFAGLSLYGYTTGRSLAGWGSFLIMGLVGVILASIVNIFLHSSALDFGLSVLSVFIFIGLTAYDTQKLKLMYNESNDEAVTQGQAISGALALYLDFINLFLLVLRFMNNRR